MGLETLDAPKLGFDKIQSFTKKVFTKLGRVTEGYCVSNGDYRPIRELTTIIQISQQISDGKKQQRQEFEQDIYHGG